MQIINVMQHGVTTNVPPTVINPINIKYTANTKIIVTRSDAANLLLFIYDNILQILKRRLSLRQLMMPVLLRLQPVPVLSHRKSG